MIRKIRKRDGAIVDFNPVKITNAIWQAAQAVGGRSRKRTEELTDKVVALLEKQIPKGEIPDVEQVQDLVEKVLIEEGHARTAKIYILYRQKHKELREIGGVLQDLELVDNYLSQFDWRVKENSNMSYSLQGLNVFATDRAISHYWLHKIYPAGIGNAHMRGDFHIHDLGTLGPYTYYGKETVMAKLNGKILLTSFEKLYEQIDAPEELLSKADDALAKYPEDLLVLDKSGWTKASRIVRKAKCKPMRFIKSDGGRSVIVTEDHPMLLENGETKESKGVKVYQDKLLTVDIEKILNNENLFHKKELFLAKELGDRGIKDFWIEGMPLEEYLKYSTNLEINGIVSTSNNANSLPNKIELTENLGYLLGFYLAEGSMDSNSISIRQKDNGEVSKLVDRLKESAYELGCRLYCRKENGSLKLKLVNTTFVKYLLKSVFNSDGTSQEKCLPKEILTYNKKFIKGLIAGVLDGDGSPTTSKTSLVIRVASRTLLEQAAIVLNLLGFTPRDRNLEGEGTTHEFKGKRIIQNYPLFGIGFRIKGAHSLPSIKYNLAETSAKAWRAEGYGWHKVLNNELTEIPDRYIYDITTESGTLLVNGMWNHNCVGWDLKDLLLLGFKGVRGKIESKPAHHFGVALMQIVNFLYTLQGEAAGAQALSNFDTLLAPFVGHDNLSYEIIKQEMQKFLFNMNVPTRVGFQSLDYKEPIVFRENGKVRVDFIGKLIEELFGKNRDSILNNVDGYGNPSLDSLAVIPKDRFEVMGFNKKGRVTWLPVRAFIKHRIRDRRFKKLRTGAGEIRVSPAHSLFKLEGESIKSVRAEELECARPNSKLNGRNHILAVNRVSKPLFDSRREVDLFDLIKELPERIRSRIFVQAEDIPQIKEKIGKLYGSLKEFLYKKRRVDKKSLYHEFSKKVVPFDFYLEYSDELRKDAKLYLKPYPKTLYDRFLRGKKLGTFLKLTAWFISEGKAVHSGIAISQEKDKSKEIMDLANQIETRISFDESRGFSNKKKRQTETVIINVKFNGLYAYLLPYLGGSTSREKVIPSFIFNLDSDYRKLFLETLFKGDGYLDQKSGRISYSSMSDKLLTSVSLLCINRGWRIRVVPKNGERAGNLLIYKNPKRKIGIAFQDLAGVPVYEIEDYENDWKWEYDISVNNKGGSENFIGGTGLVVYHNSPFTNITMDLVPPNYMQDEPTIIGGELQSDSYGDFQHEMDLINQGFAEIMQEGDSKGRPFTFPIPTYNITKDFDWEDKNLETIWKMTAKYGTPYFSNFINSDMKPEDARSMCPLGGDEKVLIRSNRGRGVEYSTIRNVYEGNSKSKEYEIYSDGKWVKGSFNKFPNQRMFKVVLENRHEIKMSVYHLNYVKKTPNSAVEELKGSELKAGMYLPYSLNPYQGEGGNRELGYFVGAYAGDGSFDRDSTVIFSLNKKEKNSVAEKLKAIAKKYFGANSVIKTFEDTELLTLKIHSKGAVGLCKDFVEGKKENKCYKPRLFETSIEFRKGVIEGQYATDGGNRNRIYTSSRKMVETLNMLVASLGTTTSMYKDERKGRLGCRPNYAVLIYQLNRENYGDVWFKKDGKLWVKIKSIEAIPNTTAYCFEVKNGEPVFTVGTTGILTHNCRLRLDKRELKKRGGGLFGSNPKTGSIGVCTINMPRIGYLSKDEDEFLERLDKLMVLAKESLEIKREVIEGLTQSGLHPYSKFYLQDIKKGFGEYWKNHFSTVGLVGMNDALLNLMNQSIGVPEGIKFALKVLEFMRGRLADFQAETGNIYNLEATPAEATSYRLAKIDKKFYPSIRIYNQEKYAGGGKEVEPYYTNSSQLPVGFTTDIFEALDLQDPLQVCYTGGTTVHIFLGEEEPSPIATKKLVRRVAESYSLPYYTITPTFSICPDHGYIAGEHSYCPHCESEGKRTPCEVYSRVVGYLRPVEQWNRGKQQEFKDRKTFDMLLTKG